jgi:sec-independent protein translocase protein TatC
MTDPDKGQASSDNRTPDSEPQSEEASTPESDYPEEHDMHEGQTDSSENEAQTGPPESSPADSETSDRETKDKKPEKKEDSDPDDYEEEEEEEEKELGGRMTFLEHLDELRRRLMFSLISIVVTFLVAWIFRERIYGFLAIPILDVVDKLVVIKPTEPFTIYLKVSFTAAVFLAAPFLLSQAWMFIAPGLYRREKIYALPFLFSSTLLFILGGAFAYYIVIPPALRFLLVEFGSEFEPMITAVEFFDFTILIIIGMGVIFQMPVLVAFLSIFGMITPRFLWKNFRYAFLIITIIAAIVSPTTDPFNLFLWSGPMVILYSISIAISWIFQRKRQRKQAVENLRG